MKLEYLAFAVMLLTIPMSCSEKPTMPDDTAKELPRLELNSLREAPVTFGAALDMGTFDKVKEYQEVVKTEFSSVSAENAMKMEKLFKGNNPEDFKNMSKYDFTEADKMVSFAIENGMRVHGHCLVWHLSNIWWLNNYSNNDPEVWKQMMKDYITAVMTHFKGKVTSWDVVNEAITDEGNMRNSIWKQKIGDEYIELAFRYAREADPDAILFYNEYGQEYSTAKVQRLVNLIQELKRNNVPVDGVGFQFHININTNEDLVRYGLRAMADQKVQVHISELDISVNSGKEPDFAFTEEISKAQQAKFRNVVSSYMDIVPEKQRFGITFWGVYDGDTWMTDDNSTDYPLPLDANFKKKDAYTGILEGLYTETK